MNNSFVTQFAENIKFNYTSFDRVIVRGYILSFFSLGVVVQFLKAMVFSKKSNGVMRIFTDQLNSHIKKYADKHDIRIFWWPNLGGGKNGAKLDFVQQEFAKEFKGTGNHVFCILTDTEHVQTVASREFTTKKGKKYQNLYKCTKPVKQYYIYVHDEVLGGPCYLKISSYLPFQSEFYFNGHNAIKLHLDREGVSYKMKENSFIEVSDPEKLQEVAQSLQGQVIQERFDYWMDRFFKFDKGKYSTRSKYLKHEWYLTQVEVCSNVIFKSSSFCRNLFERIKDKFSRIGSPDSISQIFSRRPHRSGSKSFRRLYDNNACIKHWFRGNAVKQYNKNGNLIRIETTINNPKSLGLKKPTHFLQAYYWFGLGSNNRMLDCCADVDVATICQDEPDLFDLPIPDKRGNRVAAPDLRKKRQLALMKELIKPKYRADGFKTSTLQAVLDGHFQNPAQIRYEIRKLIVRDAIKKQNGKSFYRVTESGWKWMWASITSKHFFKNPVISAYLKCNCYTGPDQPSKLEEGLGLVNQGLSQITRELAVTA